MKISMTPQFPSKLKSGDEVRVIAPSKSLKLISPQNQRLATQALTELGLNVTFGKNCNEMDIMGSSAVTSRLDDLHQAFANQNVKGILTVLGGYNCNQLLEYIDYDLIKSNPKIFCGFSDITALSNAITHMTGLVTYSGLHYSSFAMQKGGNYCLDFFKKVFFENNPIEITPSKEWSDDAWYLDQENRTFHPNRGFQVHSPGEAKGHIIGGNLGTLRLLSGTPYMPSLEGCLLFIEEIITPSGVEQFDRDLQALIQQPDFEGVQGIVIGRFEKEFGMTDEKLNYMLDAKPALKKIPIISNADFGHTMPMFTFPIGGIGHMRAGANGDVRLVLEKH